MTAATVTETAGEARSAIAPASRKVVAVTVEKPAPASPLTRPRSAAGPFLCLQLSAAAGVLQVVTAERPCQGHDGR